MVLDLACLKKKKNHFPVLIREVLEHLVMNNTSLNNSEQIFLDCTFGAGGYTEAILSYNKNAKVIAIDRDNAVSPYVNEVKNLFKERFYFFNDLFSNYPKILHSLNIRQINGIVIDLGFSHLQLEDDNRGFSFNSKNSLIMEMGLNTIKTREFINIVKEKDLADIIYTYGEENRSRKIAHKIISYREKKTIENSFELASIIRSLFPKNLKKDPATKTFQAIRIYINDELRELNRALESSLNYLTCRGRLALVSFHSLEDRIVKNFMNNNKIDKFTNCKPKSDIIKGRTEGLILIDKKPIIPQQDEVNINPPSSSAKLRVAERVCKE